MVEPTAATVAPTEANDLPDDATRALALRYGYLGPPPPTVHILPSQLPEYLGRGYRPTGNSHSDRYNIQSLEMEPPK